MQTAHAICVDGRDAERDLLIQTAFMFVFPFYSLFQERKAVKAVIQSSPDVAMLVVY